MTPSCERVLVRFSSFVQEDASAEPGHLVLALLMEGSLGGKGLTDLGVSIAGIAEGALGEAAADTAMSVIDSPETHSDDLAGREFKLPADFIATQPEWLQRVYERARLLARQSHDEPEFSTVHLVFAMAEVDGPARQCLESIGLTPEKLRHEIAGTDDAPRELKVDFELHVDDPTIAVAESTAVPLSTSPNPSQGIYAAIDANLNRSREGLRVLEDCARFVVRHRGTTGELKSLRHSLVAAEIELRASCSQLMTARDTESDPGTQLTTTGESQRSGLADVVTANARRVQESLRSLEEFGKILCPRFAADIKQIRYHSYSIEQTILNAVGSDSKCISLDGERMDTASRLNSARLYVLVTESLCRHSWKDVVKAALQGGADVIQLREKSLPDDEIVNRCRWLREICDSHNALCILNDRPDLAAKANAHGVHLGQSDGQTASARQLLNAGQLVGMSTHDLQQVRQACEQGADYLGVGPVFPSQTKSFGDFPGVKFVGEAAAAADRPWFAIGGIHRGNLSQAMNAGCERIAVCDAVIGARAPEVATRELRQMLTAAGTPARPTEKHPPLNHEV